MSMGGALCRRGAKAPPSRWLSCRLSLTGGVLTSSVQTASQTQAISDLPPAAPSSVSRALRFATEPGPQRFLQSRF